MLKQAEFKRETEGMKEMLREAKEELGFEASCWKLFAHLIMFLSQARTC